MSLKDIAAKVLEAEEATGKASHALSHLSHSRGTRKPAEIRAVEPLVPLSHSLGVGQVGQAVDDGDFEERAAIIQYDGDAPPAWAEGLARLDPNNPPGDVPPQRWVTFCNDAGRFLDRWAARAAALGWGSLDLFGCDARKPFARIDRLGLMWLLNGDHLVALSETSAIIGRGTGARQTYRRRPTQSKCVLAWDLASA
jgi:hypothetical protein